MNSELYILVLSAITIAFVHTAAGPDHYLPFIVLSRARQWSFARTMVLTIACGLAHITSSLVLAGVVALLGWSLTKIQWLQGLRGGIAGWLLIGFGVAYTLWAIWQKVSNKRHKHFDLHPDGQLYVYEHQHAAIQTPIKQFKVTPWVLFVLFVLGPCEPLMPLLYLPAVQKNVSYLLVLVIVYALVTLATMSAMVLLGRRGIAMLNSERMEKNIHLVAGGSLLMCGVGMVFFAW